jgi:DNA-binding transcriptional ArsR family regulator
MHTQQQRHDLDRIFQALSDPTRREILSQVMAGERTVSDIARPHRMTFAAVSKHLKVLESARLVERRRQGSFQIIKLNPPALESANQWLERYRSFWTGRLNALKDILEEGHGQE